MSYTITMDQWIEEKKSVREIKFKAMMIEPHPGHEGMWVYVSGVGSSHWYSKNGTYYGKIKRGTECQFTEYKDKNSVDVYDGDILAGVNNHIVEWQDDRWCIRSLGINWTTGLKTALFQYDIEVVSNIYENPVLIEGGIDAMEREAE